MTQPSVARARPSRALVLLLLAALSLLAVARSWWGTRLDSFTIDEPWHIVAGVTHLRGDFALNPEQTPLAKLWVAAWMGGRVRVPATPAMQDKLGERAHVEDVMYRDNDARVAQARARVAMWTFHGLLLFAVGVGLWRTLGAAWAAGTLGFLALEPAVGAHLPVVMTDLPAALTLLLASICLGLLLARRRWPLALVLGLALGLALGAKHSTLPGLAGLALLGGLAVPWIARREGLRAAGRTLAMLALAGVLALAVLWAQYGLRFHARADGSDGFNRPMAAKVDDLRLAHWRDALHAADGARLLPRAYLWGLADTVRAGIEGRGPPVHKLWGHRYQGAPPWHAWPSLIVSKLPLPLLAMSLLGLLALWRAPLPSGAGWTLAAVLAMAMGYFASLLGSHTTYAGVRHALPVVMAVAVLGGALVWRLWHMRRPGLRLLAVAPLALALLVTVREPRLWEYHNELAGGTTDAWRNFSNESVDLGQRFHELHRHGDGAIVRSGQPLFYDYWLNRAQARANGLPLRRRVVSMADDNLAGIYEGWFAMPVSAREPWPEFGWDPKEGLRGLRPVARYGYLELWHGRQQLPLARADSAYGHAMDYLYKDGGTDWALAAQRLSEVVKVIPAHVGAGLELGNMYLRMGDRARAKAAYQGVLDRDRGTLDGLTRGELKRQVVALAGNTPLERQRVLRNPWME